jgi:hypothetical protein
LVIAGFGEQDIFPVVTALTVYRVSEDRLRVGSEHSYPITFEDQACVFPFAQRDLVSTFMEGIDPNYGVFIEDGIRDLLVEVYPALISATLSGVPGIDANALREKLVEVGNGAVEHFVARTKRFREEKYSDPITYAVSFLPKEDLAALAESLVNLTSLKKRVTLDPETVGGPIDVVVISKGDGLVWMKRKHYFRGDLNPHFFTNYFREGRQ